MHTNLERHRGLFIGIQIQSYGNVQKKVSKSLQDRDKKHFIFIHLFIRLYNKATEFSSIVRTGIILTPNPNPRVCCWGFTNENAG